MQFNPELPAITQVGLQLLAVVAQDQHRLTEARLGQRRQNMVDQWPPGHRHQTLGAPIGAAPQSVASAGGQHYYFVGHTSSRLYLTRPWVALLILLLVSTVYTKTPAAMYRDRLASGATLARYSPSVKPWTAAMIPPPSISWLR